MPLHQMLELGIVLDAFQLAFYNQKNITPYLPVIALDFQLHLIFAALVNKGPDFRYFLIPLILRRNPVIIHHNFSMEDFLFNSLVKIVRYSTDKKTLCQGGYFGSRYQAV